jgi:hypothetical protein
MLILLIFYIIKDFVNFHIHKIFKKCKLKNNTKNKWLTFYLFYHNNVINKNKLYLINYLTSVIR